MKSETTSAKRHFFLPDHGAVGKAQANNLVSARFGRRAKEQKNESPAYHRPDYRARRFRIEAPDFLVRPECSTMNCTSTAVAFAVAFIIFMVVFLSIPFWGPLVLELVQNRVDNHIKKRNARQEEARVLRRVAVIKRAVNEVGAKTVQEYKDSAEATYAQVASELEELTSQ